MDELWPPGVPLLVGNVTACSWVGHAVCNRCCGGGCRSDDLEALELWAPKLSMLGLRACYSLEHVRIKDDENPAGTQPTPLTVGLPYLVHGNGPGSEGIGENPSLRVALWFGVFILPLQTHIKSRTCIQLSTVCVQP